MRLTPSAAGLAAALLLGALSPAFAAAPPSSGRLAFDVMRKDADIGDQVFTFSGKGADFDVSVATDIAVRVPLIRAKVSRKLRLPDRWQRMTRVFTKKPMIESRC